jgi:hypothetical protein
LSGNLFFRNGIDIETGDYLSRPFSESQIVDLACGRPLDDVLACDLKKRHEIDKQVAKGVSKKLEARDLALVGWGVIFAQDDPRATEIRQALDPLLKWRKKQAGKRCGHFYQEYIGKKGLAPGTSARAFLASHGATPGTMADPDNVPYYLLIVGDPHRISYQFQYELDVQYAVGRIYFDRTTDYARYARSVVAAESTAGPETRRAVLFGVENPKDELSEISCRKLVEPMADKLEAPAGWKIDRILGSEANKERLAGLLGGAETPSLLLTAGHGIGYAKDSKTRRKIQGSLICSDWRGPGFGGRPGDYFSAADLPRSANLQGLISFHFACYSAGIPHENEFVSLNPDAKKPLARRPFVARLPQRMLNRPAGGALAVVGHVDSAWDAPTQLKVFVEAFDLLMLGYPVGAAIDAINERHAALAVELVELLKRQREGKAHDDSALRKVWTETYDTKAYTVVGDPAVRVPGTWKGKP